MTRNIKKRSAAGPGAAEPGLTERNAAERKAKAHKATERTAKTQSIKKLIAQKLKVVAIMIFAVVVAFCGCANPSPVDPLPPENPPATPTFSPEDDWGIYLYLCGSNLETKMGAAGKNIDEILAADIPDGVNVVIETGGAKRWRSHDIPNDALCRYTVEDGKLSTKQQLENSSMGSDKTLADFIGYCFENYPAKRTALILWDHGGGASGEVCYDENYGMDCLTPLELNKALSAAGAHFDLIGFDACLMATNDTAALVHGYADYMLASEEITPTGGWDYKAILENLSADKSVEDTGRAAVDAYIKKCENSHSGDMATLSLFDLSKYNKFLSAFDDFALSLTEASEQQYGNFAVVRASEQACKFGAIGRDEGASNLIDLYDFASMFPEDNAKASALTAAIDELVPYKSGVGRKDLGGVSLFYPLYYDEASLSKYLSLCSSQAYKNYLINIYGDPSGYALEFTDRGSVADDGSFQIGLQADSKKYLKSVEFSIVTFEYNSDDYSVEAVQLGIDNDLDTNWDSLTFKSNFRGIWLALDGAYLNYSVVEIRVEYILFSAPVIANGVRSNLRFMFVYDDNYFNNGYYKIIGLWDGLDEYNLTDKQVTPLKEGDTITTLRRKVDPDSHIPFDRAELSEGETVVIGSDGGEVKELPIKQQSLYYVFMVNDIFGNTFYSDTALMVMKYTYDELLENPLPDYEYAADVTDIFENESWGAVG